MKREMPGLIWTGVHLLHPHIWTVYKKEAWKYEFTSENNIQSNRMLIHWIKQSVGLGEFLMIRCQHWQIHIYLCNWDLEAESNSNNTYYVVQVRVRVLQIIVYLGRHNDHPTSVRYEDQFRKILERRRFRTQSRILMATCAHRTA